ncbi:unnamed protein product [Pocillopora meandrina]|uniref:Acyl-CoA thioester hydrolase/bile acid-CoA amino acid N-acetyltransferase domain-containing protein n=1 Tax=Pocillopora meandrina TaxID=46732 RepID=A0AAU9WWR4_9CNID|nr:unnamed protein product [Pocillopora meandrina]
MITLWPKFSLIDKITKINVFRLKPLQKITLGARVVGDSGQVFNSYACFIATEHGQVDVSREPSFASNSEYISRYSRDYLIEECRHCAEVETEFRN